VLGWALRLVWMSASLLEMVWAMGRWSAMAPACQLEMVEYLSPGR